MNTKILRKASTGLAVLLLAAGCASAHAQPAPPPPAAVGHYAQIGALKMYYEVHGTGRPLLLLHGGGSTLETSFGTLLPTLEKTHRVIAVEQQAHGHTADIERPLSFEQMADDTAALLAELHVDQADVFGFSNGGVVALELALRHPTVVHKLVLASSYFKHDCCVTGFWEGFPHATVDQMPVALKTAYRQVAPHPEALEQGLFQKTVSMMLAFQDLDPSALRGIHAPTLVMVGDKDVIRVEHAVEMTHVLPNAELAVFPDSVHGAYLGVAEGAVKRTSRAPAAAALMIDDFLAD